MKVLNIGSLNIDYVYQVKNIVLPGETITASNLEMFAGGKGWNQSIALARAGATIYHAGLIGEDGKFLISIGEQSNVHTEYIELVKERTGNAIIQVAKDGQNSILLYPGANHCFTKEYIDDVLANFDEGDILLLQNEVNLVAYMITVAHQKGMKIYLNPSPFDERVQNCDLTEIDTFLINEVEGWQITGKKEPKEILKSMLTAYPNANIVLTLGEAGAYFHNADIQIFQPAKRVAVVDTTAAGDTFTGYFIASLLAGKEYSEAMLQASKAAAMAVSKKGATISIPYQKEIK